MSLYRISEKERGSIGNYLALPPGLPVSLILLSAYLALITFVNSIFGLSLWVKYIPRDISILIDPSSSPALDEFAREAVYSFLGHITGILSVVALIIFLLYRRTISILFLLVAAVFDILRRSGVIDDSNPLLYYSLNGLDAIPYALIGLLGGWEGMGMNLGASQVIGFLGSAISLCVCALLYYFHLKSSKVLRR